MPEAAPVVTAPELNVNPTKPAPAAPETVEVKVGDKTLKVSKDAAEAISALQQSVSEQAAVAATLKAQADAAAAVKPKPAAPEENYDKLFQDPKTFLSDFAKQIKDELRSEYTQTTLQREFWADFYKAHADLAKHDFYVKAVLDRDLPKIGKMKTTEAIQELGKTVKAELLALSGKPPTTGGKPPTEGGTERLPGESKPESESSPTELQDTLTGLIKARREARRRGAQPRATA